MSQYTVKPDDKHGPPVEVPAFVIEVQAESALEGLLAMLEPAQAEAAEAKQRFDSLKDQIKSEVSGQAPGRERIIIRSRFLSRDWVMRSQESWLIDSKMLKAKEPLKWVEYAYKRVAWYLEATKAPKS